MQKAVFTFITTFSTASLALFFSTQENIVSPLAAEQTLVQTSAPTSQPSIFPTPTVELSPSPLVPTATPSSTPKPTSTPVVSPITSAQFEEWFTKYAAKESISRDLLKKIAVCESNLKINAVNGIYGGLYQFSTSAWKNTRIRMNENSDADLRFDPEEAIKTAAFRLATSGASAWPNCSK